MTFDPKSKVKSIQGRDYLEVKWRIVWFREDHPKGGIVTEVENTDPALIKASILDEEGHVLGTGYGSPKTQGVSKFRPFEGAETAAIGRALAHAGYGTQFTGEDEEEHLADSPVERSVKPAKVTAPPLPNNRPYDAETVKERLQTRVQYHLDEKTTASQNDRNVLASILDTTLQDKTKRYELCNWLVGQASTKKMKQADVNALLDWLGVRQFNAMPEDHVIKEIHAAHTAALKASGQQELIPEVEEDWLGDYGDMGNSGVDA